MTKFNIGAIVISAFLLIIFWGIFIPDTFIKKPEVVYVVLKGMGYKEIGIALEKQGIIKSHGFFTAYVLMSLNYSKLQAGSYSVSPSMSVADIVGKMVSGDVVKNNVTIIEGWNLQDIGAYLESKNIGLQKDFLALAKIDVSNQYDFLKDKPKKLSLEGYLFPDTYDAGKNPSQEALVKNMLDNFGKKLTPDLRKGIINQHKSIFQIVTMASILEKEVKTLDDKKIVSGILWKRIDGGVPLQVDSTINYITGKSDTSVSIKDTTVNSPYNTYKYYGLPLGPISNPGIDSILAAIYPTKSDYWYYLSSNKTGVTIFSKTLDEQNAAAAKYLQ